MRAQIALKMEAAIISETLINFYQTTRRNNPEDSHLHNNLLNLILQFFELERSMDKDSLKNSC
jgi:hypothetical protein